MTPLQIVTLQILDHATKFQWSVQGFGMLRLYIRGVGRLHIWDSALRYPNVSMIHTHSWDLRSTIVAGRLRNTRFIEMAFPHNGQPHWKQRLLTGYNSHMVNKPTLVGLTPEPTEYYYPLNVDYNPLDADFGHRWYEQRASEIHLTDADDGTVTLMERHEDVDGHADVYWPHHCTWGTAIPRQATEAEVVTTVAKAIAKLEGK